MLNAAIAKEPERTDLRVKLLGVFLETRDQTKFIDAFRELEAMGDQEAIAEVKESMSAVEGVSDWLRDEDAAPVAHAEPAGVDDDDTDLDFDLDDDEEFGETLIREPDAAPESTTPDKAEVDDLDLGSLDLDDLDADEADSELSLGDTTERKPEASLEEDDLSFDLDLDDDLDLGGLEDDDSKPSEGSAGKDVGGGELSLDDLDEDFDLGELDDELSLEGDSEGPLTPELEPEDDELSLDEADIAPAPSAPAEPAPEPEPAPSVEKPDAKAEDSFDDLELDDFNFDEDSAAAGLDDLESDDMSDDLGLLGDSDEVATKLDLARAYIDMGDADGAREMLQEVMEEGNDEQKQDANELLSRL